MRLAVGAKAELDKLVQEVLMVELVVVAVVEIKVTEQVSVAKAEELTEKMEPVAVALA